MMGGRAVFRRKFIVRVRQPDGRDEFLFFRRVERKSSWLGKPVMVMVKKGDHAGGGFVDSRSRDRGRRGGPIRT